jgi:hypothetical protein
MSPLSSPYPFLLPIYNINHHSLMTHDSHHNNQQPHFKKHKKAEKERERDP